MSKLEITNKYYGDVTDSWKQDHNDAMCARDLDDMVVTGIRFFDTLIQRNEQAACINLNDLNDLAEYHIHWNQVTNQLLSNVGILEDKGYIIENADKLRARFKKSNAFLPKCVEMKEAAGRLLGGESYTIEEVFDGLQGKD